MNQWGIVTTFGTDTNLLLQPKGTGGLVISNSETNRPAQGPSLSNYWTTTRKDRQ